MTGKFAVPSTVEFGDGVVVIRRNGTSEPILATILGMEKDSNGEIKAVWLDRFVHRLHETFDGWMASGAVSTVFTRLQ